MHDEVEPSSRVWGVKLMLLSLALLLIGLAAIAQPGTHEFMAVTGEVAALPCAVPFVGLYVGALMAAGVRLEILTKDDSKEPWLATTLKYLLVGLPFGALVLGVVGFVVVRATQR